MWLKNEEMVPFSKIIKENRPEMENDFEKNYPLVELIQNITHNQTYYASVTQYAYGSWHSQKTNKNGISILVDSEQQMVLSSNGSKKK